MKYSCQAVIAYLTRGFGLPLFIAALLCAIGLPVSAQIPTKQLQFDFNDTGTTTTDSVHQIVLDLRSSPPTGSALDIHASPGPAGNDNCLSWTSAGGGGFGGPVAITIGNTNFAFGIVTNFTISMWVNAANMGGGINPRIFLMGTNGVVDPTAANGFGWRGNSSGGYVAAYNNVNTAALFSSLLPANQWVYVAWTYTNGTWRLYSGNTNAPVSQKATETDAFTAANLGTSFTLALGNRADATSRTFAGQLAHVNFYVGTAQPDFVEYLRESLFPLGSLTWITAPAGPNLDFSTSGLTLATNQNLTGGGSVSGNVTNSAGSAILPGYGSNIGTLTLNSNLTLVDGGKLGFYLGTPSDTLTVKGSLDASGVTSIAISNIPPVGTYTLLTVSNTFGPSLANFQVVSNANLVGKVVSLAINSKRLQLTVAGARAAANLTWAGDTANGLANAWNIITTSNWLNGASLDTYYNGDTANFTDAGTNISGTINQPTLAVTVNPAAVNFNATNSYSLTGSGAIAGNCGITKSGSGTLALQTANSYSGGTLVNGGVLAIGSVSALGSPTSTLVTITNGAAFDISGKTINNSLASAVVASGSGVATNQGAIFSSVGMADPLNSFPIGIRTLSLASDTTIGNDTQTWQLGTDINANNQNGSFLDGQGHSLTKVGDNTLVLEVRNISPLSQLTIANGGVIYANTSAGGILNSPIGFSASIVISNNAWLSSWNNNSALGGGGIGNTISNNITIGAGGGQLLNTLGHQSGSGIACRDVYYGNVFLNDNLTINDNSFYNGIYGTMTFAGVISGTGNVTVAGDQGNSVTFNGNNTYNGSTTVSNYVKLLTTTANQGGGAYDVVDNAILDVALTNSQPTLPMSSLTLDQQNIGGGYLSFSRISFPSATTPIISATNLIINAGTIVPPATNYAVGQFPLVKYVGTIGGTGGFSALQFDSGSLPANVTAELTNNLANHSIDLLVTSAPSTLPSTSTNITFQVAGSQLTLSWPANYLGWLLQSNSVGLIQTNAWFLVPGSDSTTQQVIQIDATKPAVFYRMIHP